MSLPTSHTPAYQPPPCLGSSTPQGKAGQAALNLLPIFLLEHRLETGGRHLFLQHSQYLVLQA